MQNEIDPGLVQTFVRVIQGGSFSEAARREGLAPSSVSRQITALESLLDVRLLHRSTRQLTLTEAGAALYQRASALFEELDEAYDAATRFNTAIRGSLRVSVPPAFGLRWISPLIPEFLRAYPELKLDIALQDRFVDLVGEGFHVAIRAGHLNPSALIAKRLADNNRILCAGPGYLRRSGCPQTPAALADHNCLSFRYVDATAEWRFRKDGVEQTIAIDGSLESNNGNLLLEAVENDIGIALLPHWMAADSLRAQRCRRVLADYEVTATDFDSSIHALYESRQFLPAKVRAFLNFLEGKFSPAPPWA